MSADLVEKDGAPLGAGEAARLVLPRIGEGAFPVPEQLGFQQGVGQGAAIHRHKRPVTPRRKVVQGPGHKLLACSARPLDEHRALALGHLG